MVRRRWWKPWQRQDEFGFSEGLSAGWQLTLVVAGLVAIGLLSYWIGDMHHYAYGIFAP